MGLGVKQSGCGSYSYFIYSFNKHLVGTCCVSGTNARSHLHVWAKMYLSLTFFALGKPHQQRSAASEGSHWRGTSQDASLWCVMGSVLTGKVAVLGARNGFVT